MMRRALLGWLIGLAILAFLAAAAARFFDAREFAQVWKELSWPWLVPALALQAATYLAQGQVWRVVARAAGLPVSKAEAGVLSLGKLFIDQAVPSAGVSGTLFAAAALERRGAPGGAKAACVIVEFTSYYAATAAALGAVIILASSRGGPLSAVALPAAAFLLYAAVVSAGLLGLTKRVGALALARRTPLRHIFAFLGEADQAITHDARLFLEAAGSQLAIILLDAATLWLLLRSVGVAAPPGPVFVSFMAASLLRSVAVSPGGLGAFEAGCTAALMLAGVPAAAALSATLLFRALSFWLPMLPGFVAWRRERTRPKGSIRS